MRKFLGTVALAALPFVASGLGQAQRQYSIKDVQDTMAARGVKNIYLSPTNYSIRAGYIDSVGEPVLFIQGLENSGANEKYRGLIPNDRRIEERFQSGEFDSILVRICGPTLGDDDCDYVNRNGKQFESGKKINPESKSIVENIIDETGQALAQIR